MPELAPTLPVAALEPPTLLAVAPQAVPAPDPAPDQPTSSLADLVALVLDDLPDASMLGADAEGRLTIAVGSIVAGRNPGAAALGAPLRQALEALGVDALADAMDNAPRKGAARLRIECVEGRSYQVAVRRIALAGEETVVLATLNDTTSELLVERDLHEAAQRFSMAFDNAHIGMALIGADGCWLQVNTALCELVGYNEGQLLERTMLDVTHPEDLEIDIEPMLRLLGGELRSYDFEKRLRTASGETIWVLWCASLIRDQDDEPLYLVVQVENITARHQLEQELADAARRDSLTGVGNRRAFDEQLERQLALSRRHGEPSALLLIDLDRFKQINDTLGHAVGDSALCHLATILTARMRSTDMVARLGGDEFVVLLPHTDRAGADTIRRAITRALGRSPLASGGTTVTLSASIGLTTLAESEGSAAEVLRLADADMYERKARHHAGDR